MDVNEVAIIRIWNKTDPNEKDEKVRVKDTIFCYIMSQLVEELEKIRNMKDCSFSIYIAHLYMEDARLDQ